MPELSAASAGHVPATARTVTLALLTLCTLWKQGGQKVGPAATGLTERAKVPSNGSFHCIWTGLFDGEMTSASVHDTCPVTLQPLGDTVPELAVPVMFVTVEPEQAWQIFAEQL